MKRIIVDSYVYMWMLYVGREMKTLVRGFLSSHIKELNRNDLLYSASVMCEVPNWPSKTVSN